MSDLIGDWLRRAAARSEQQLATALAGENVTLHEWAVLRTLHDGPAAPSEVAERTGLTRGAITKLVDRLRVRRMVVRAAGGSADRRRQTLALTGAGARLVARVAVLADASDAALVAGLDAADRERLATLLRRLVEPGSE